jgi:hypothetical protein
MSVEILSLKMGKQTDGEYFAIALLIFIGISIEVASEAVIDLKHNLQSTG